MSLGLMLPSHDAASQTRTPIHFSIAAQPLAAALDSYSVTAGLDLYYDGDLATGRRSHSIEGMLPPEAALQELLTGSGLVARATGPHSFTIRPASHLGSANQQTYFTAVQERVSQALCTRAETKPVDADLLLQLWITSTGAIQRVQLLDTPNADVRESVFATALRGVSIGTAPPVELRQPIVVAIPARGKSERIGCVDLATTTPR